MSAIDFLNVEDVLQLHEDLIDRYGGTHGIRSDDLLQSAVAQPQATFGTDYLHSDIFHMAAAYAFHIAQNQPFLDGNKRTGLHAALVFLDFNGYSISPSTRLVQAMIQIAEHCLDKEGLATVFRELSHLESPQ